MSSDTTRVTPLTTEELEVLFRATGTSTLEYIGRLEVERAAWKQRAHEMCDRWQARLLYGEPRPAWYEADVTGETTSPLTGRRR